MPGLSFGGGLLANCGYTHPAQPRGPSRASQLPRHWATRKSPTREHVDGGTSYKFRGRCHYPGGPRCRAPFAIRDERRRVVALLGSYPAPPKPVRRQNDTNTKHRDLYSPARLSGVRPEFNILIYANFHSVNPTKTMAAGFMNVSRFISSQWLTL